MAIQMQVSDLVPGQHFKVLRMSLSKEVGKRLVDMGFTEGRRGVVIRRGLIGGPMHVRILGYDLLIRRSEAAGIEVEPLAEGDA